MTKADRRRWTVLAKRHGISLGTLLRIGGFVVEERGRDVLRTVRRALQRDGRRALRIVSGVAEDAARRACKVPPL